MPAVVSHVEDEAEDRLWGMLQSWDADRKELCVRDEYSGEVVIEIREAVFRC